MSPHKFSLGQTVTVRAGAAEGHIPSGTYTISRILPGDDLDRSYRAKHVGDGHERVLREKQIEAHDWAASPGPAERPAPARRASNDRLAGFGRGGARRSEG